METPNSKSLLTLPTEIQVMIYRHAIESSGQLMLVKKALADSIPEETHDYFPVSFDANYCSGRQNLLYDEKNIIRIDWFRTCREIHRLAKNILFKETCFHIVPVQQSLDDTTTSWGLPKYWGGISPANLVDVHLHWASFSDSEDVFDAVTELWSCKKLQRFAFTIDKSVDDMVFMCLLSVFELVMDFRPEVKKKLHLPAMRYEPKSDDMPSEFFKRWLGNMSDLLVVTNFMFGGELWVRGKLWMKDYILQCEKTDVLRLFVEDVETDEAKIQDILEDERILGSICPATEEERTSLRNRLTLHDLLKLSMDRSFAH